MARDALRVAPRADAGPRRDEPPRPGAKGGTFRRLGWFVLLWLAGVATVGTVAFILRIWIA